MDPELDTILLAHDKQSVNNLKNLLDRSNDLSTLLAGKTTSGKSVLSILFKTQDKGGLLSSKPQICVKPGPPDFLVSQMKYILLRLYGAKSSDEALSKARQDCEIDARFFENLEHLTKLIIALYKLNGETLSQADVTALIADFKKYNDKYYIQYTANNDALIEFFKNLDSGKQQDFTDSTPVRTKHKDLYDVIRPKLFPNDTNIASYMRNSSNSESNSKNNKLILGQAFGRSRSSTPTPPLPAETNTERERREIKEEMVAEARAKAAARIQASKNRSAVKLGNIFGGARRTRKPRRKNKTRRNR